MAHKCYVSFKTEDAAFKDYIQNHLALDMIDRSLNEPIGSTNEDYILRKIREDYLADSTVTIHLIGLYGAEERGAHEQRFIKRELQGSLYDSESNTRNGILGVVLPDRMSTVYKDSYSCGRCGGQHNYVGFDDTTTVREFWYNYYIPNGKCAHTEDERFCVAVGWSDFVKRPADYIEKAFAKRSDPISKKVRVYGHT